MYFQAEHCLRCSWLERNGNGGTVSLGSLSQGIGAIFFSGDCHPWLHTMKKTMDILPSIYIYTYLDYNFRGLMESLKQCQPCWRHKRNRLCCINPCWMSTYWVSSTVLGALHSLFHYILSTILRGCSFAFQTRKVGLKEVKWLTKIAQLINGSASTGTQGWPLNTLHLEGLRRGAVCEACTEAHIWRSTRKATLFFWCPLGRHRLKSIQAEAKSLKRSSPILKSYIHEFFHVWPLSFLLKYDPFPSH